MKRKTITTIVIISALMVLCVSCASSKYSEDNIKYDKPPHFSFNGEDYYYYTKKENGVFVDVRLDKLPEGYDGHGVIGPENKPEDLDSLDQTGVSGLEYYYNSEDLSIIYVYTLIMEEAQGGIYRNYYKYIPYALPYKLDK